MPVARIYLPAGPTEVAVLRAARMLPAGTSGIAVGPGGTEEDEHLAWLAAADLAGEQADRNNQRRVVIAADVDVTLLDPTPAVRATACATLAPVPLKRIVSFHVDEAIGSAVADLLWYDVTELDDVHALTLDA